MITISKEVAINSPTPVALVPNEWNVASLRRQIESHFLDAINVQRNRARLTKCEKSFPRETVDTVRGLKLSLRSLGRHAAARYRKFDRS